LPCFLFFSLSVSFLHFLPSFVSVISAFYSTFLCTLFPLPSFQPSILNVSLPCFLFISFFTAFHFTHLSALFSLCSSCLWHGSIIQLPSIYSTSLLASFLPACHISMKTAGDGEPCNQGDTIME
jgi:hypothetical protein